MYRLNKFGTVFVMFKNAIIALFVYSITTLLSYFLFRSFTPGTTGLLNTKLSFNGSTVTPTIKDEEPKTEECPLNGEKWSKTKRALWEKRRPLGVMIENSPDARPQSGLSNADVVFEAVAEGGVTRFLSIYYCKDAPILGPVRSARVYFLDFIGGFGDYPLYAHVGGANTDGPADALGQIETMGWAVYNDLNQFSIGFPTFWRDPERLPGVATEHTMYTSTKKLWDIGVKRELTNTDAEGVSWDAEFEKWAFKDDAALAARKNQFKVTFGFWEDYKKFNVVWKYDKNTNTYLRTNGGKKHLDKNTGQQLVAKNVVVVFMDESVAKDGYEKGQHLLYGTLGSGDMLLFQDGSVVKGTWNKLKRASQIKFMDARGVETKFNRGQIWIEVLPTGNSVKY